MNLNKKTASQLSEMLNNKECSSKEITASFLAEIEKSNSDINAFITVSKEKAIEQAEKADEIISKGTHSVLTGIPIAIKDNINVKGLLTTCGSKMLANYISPYNATVVEHINNNGMVILGKLNMDEFAIGTSGASSYFKPTKNPVNYDYVPGGSSSGSAASVAAFQTPLSLGSDTGGSIRVPCSYCGVVGFKPTYGTVSRYGAVALASSFDQIGPVGRSVKDVAMFYDVIKGYDKRDATTLNINSESSLSNFEKPLSGVKIGLIKDFFSGSAEVIDSVVNAAKEMEKQGATLINLEMPSLEHALSAYYIISSAEISSNMGKYDGVRFGFRAENYNQDYNDMFIKTRSQGFGPEVQERIMVGTYVLTKDQYHTFFTRAKTVQKKVIQDFRNIFDQCDILLTPTTLETAFKANHSGDTSEIYTSDFVTSPVNLAGLPAISVPCGLDSNKLPIGMQLIGRELSETYLLGVANKYEELVGGFTSIGGNR